MAIDSGHPACPAREVQAKRFALPEPVRFGVQLTEGFMMEAAVSALVFHHPDAGCFSVGEQAAG